MGAGRVRLSGGTLEDINAESQQSCTRSLRDLSIHSGDRLLLWTGSEATLSNEVELLVHYYAPLPDNANAQSAAIPAPQVVAVPRMRDSLTVAELAKTLEEYIHVPARDQLICKSDASGCKWMRDHSKSLFECNITESCIVTVELMVMSEGKKGRPISLAMRAYDEQENKLSLMIVNCFVTPPDRVQIECSKEDTVDELKVHLLSIVPHGMLIHKRVRV
jgi:hypothetical protein